MAIGVGAALLGSAGIQAGTSILGSFLNSGRSAEAQDSINYNRQKEFAQNQIQWRALDAEKAGLSKFAALGGSNSFYTPSYSGASDNIGDTVENIGNIAGSSLSKYAVLAQEEALQGAKLDNEKKKIDLLEKISTLNAEGKGQGVATGNYIGQNGNLKLPNEKLLEQYEDSMFGIPFKLAGLEEALSKDKFGAYKDFKQMFGGFSKGIEDAYETRGWHGAVKSVPVFDLSKYSAKEREALAKVLLDKTPLLNKAVNSGWSPADIREWIIEGNSKYLNNVLQGYDPVGSNDISIFGKKIYSGRRSL